MVWFCEAENGEQVIAQHGVLAPLFDNFYASFYQQAHIPPVVLELCRLRVAQLHKNAAEFRLQLCDVEFGQRDALVNWPSSEVFSEAQRSCLALAEVYSMDVHAISDAHTNAVKQHYGDAGLVALIQALGVFYGLTRMGQVWGVEGAAP
ncbi:MAG: carboxymuconolactone decarboxylase family protein [Pseudomonadales bacterium]